MAVSASPHVEVQLTPGTWTDITTDVVSPLHVRSRRGIEGSGPRARVASTGTLTFTLRNDAGCSGGLLGYYSPNHANCRAGWTFGIPVRFVVIYSSTEYPLWRGVIRTIVPTPGQRLERRVAVTAVDVMDAWGSATLRAIEPAVDQNAAELIQALSDASEVPLWIDDATDGELVDLSGLGTTPTYPYAFVDVRDGANALSLLSNVAHSELAYAYPAADGTFVAVSAHTRATQTSSVAFTEADMVGDLVVPDSLAGVYNHVRGTVHPKTIDTGDNTDLYALSEPLLLPANSTTELWGAYVDPSNDQKFVGGIPLFGHEYVANTQADNLGTIVTSSVTVTPSAYASACKFVITNPLAQAVYLTSLTLIGNGVYDNAPVTVESYTAMAYGKRQLVLDFPYLSDANLAQDLCDYLVAQYQTPGGQVEAVRINPHRSHALMLACLQLEIGDVVTLTETMTGLSNTEAYVQGVDVDAQTGSLLSFRYTLAPRMSSTAWILGTSVLGTDTVLGFV